MNRNESLPKFTQVLEWVSNEGSLCACVCVCACVCEREREQDERKSKVRECVFRSECVYFGVCVCVFQSVCVCVI